MQQKRIIIPLCVALIIAVGVAFYFFFQAKSMKESGHGSEIKVASNDSISSYLALGTIDSLLFEGRYEDALQAYQRYLNDSNLHINNFIEQRIQFARKVLYLQQQLVVLNSTDTISVDTLTIARTATPMEVRQYDSIQFALTKTKVQVQNLKRQLLRKDAGQYLVFTTSKGSKVHYVGKVKNEKANGQGIALFETGSRYEGEWKNNLRDGKGTFYWTDGEYYVGDYRNDKRDGHGTYYWPNGEKFAGQWTNDQRNGKGIFFGKEGEIVAQGTWQNDELVKVVDSPK